LLMSAFVSISVVDFPDCSRSLCCCWPCCCWCFWSRCCNLGGPEFLLASLPLMSSLLLLTFFFVLGVSTVVSGIPAKELSCCWCPWVYKYGLSDRICNF
jgi:hypothetical protein